MNLFPGQKLPNGSIIIDSYTDPADPQRGLVLALHKPDSVFCEFAIWTWHAPDNTFDTVTTHAGAYFEELHPAFTSFERSIHRYQIGAA